MFTDSLLDSADECEIDSDSSGTCPKPLLSYPFTPVGSRVCNCDMYTCLDNSYH